MNYKYGEFSENQIQETKQKMRKQIFFLLLCVDPKTKNHYTNVNVNEVFENVLTLFGGLNELLSYPQELVDVMSLIEAAKHTYNTQPFNWLKYRKDILDAGHLVLSIKEV